MTTSLGERNKPPLRLDPYRAKLLVSYLAQRTNPHESMTSIKKLIDLALAINTAGGFITTDDYILAVDSLIESHSEVLNPATVRDWTRMSYAEKEHEAAAPLVSRKEIHTGINGRGETTYLVVSVGAQGQWSHIETFSTRGEAKHWIKHT